MTTVDGAAQRPAQGGHAGRPTHRPGRHARAASSPATCSSPSARCWRSTRPAAGTLREALRLLEFQGVISLKPGPRGGPVLQNPDAAHLGSTLVLLMQLKAAPFRNIVEVRSALEPMISSLAADPDDRRDARRAARAPIDQMRDRDGRPVLVPRCQQAVPRHHRLVVGQHPVRLHHRVAARDHGRHRDRYRLPRLPSPGHPQGARARSTQALEARDPVASEARMREHIDAYERYVERKFPQLLEQTIPWDQRIFG